MTVGVYPYTCKRTCSTNCFCNCIYLMINKFCSIMWNVNVLFLFEWARPFSSYNHDKNEKEVRMRNYINFRQNYSCGQNKDGFLEFSLLLIKNTHIFWEVTIIMLYAFSCLPVIYFSKTDITKHKRNSCNAWKTWRSVLTGNVFYLNCICISMNWHVCLSFYYTLLWYVSLPL